MEDTSTVWKHVVQIEATKGIKLGGYNAGNGMVSFNLKYLLFTSQVAILDYWSTFSN